MKIVNYVCIPSNHYQTHTYPALVQFSSNRPLTGRVIMIIASAIDAALEVLTRPLEAIQYLVVTIINLLGAPFSKECSLADSLHNGSHVLNRVIIMVAQPFASTIALIAQIFTILINPKNGETQTCFWLSFNQSVHTWQSARLSTI